MLSLGGWIEDLCIELSYLYAVWISSASARFKNGTMNLYKRIQHAVYGVLTPLSKCLFQTTMKLQTRPVVFIARDRTVVLLIDCSCANQVMANTRNSGDGHAASRIIAGAGTKQWNRLVNLTMPKSSLGIDNRNDAFRRMHDH